MPITHVVPEAGSVFEQHDFFGAGSVIATRSFDFFWQHEATFGWQQDLGFSFSTYAGTATPCSTAHASFCSRVKQQQSFQQLSALMQPQARVAQGNGALRSLPLGRAMGIPKQAIR